MSSGDVIRVVSPGQAIVSGILHAQAGDRVAARGLPAFETRYPTIVVTRPWLLPPVFRGRDPKWVIGALEACSLVGQTSVPEWLTDRLTAFAKFREAGTFWGAYGPRVAGQLGLVVEALRRDPDSRQAVVTIFDGHRDLLRETKDVPCTLSIQFMIRGGALEARVTMRSNDAWLGLTYDVVQFIALQGAIAKALDVPMGPYVHQPGSLHLYATDAHKTNELAYEVEPARPYEPLWSGSSIDEISETARRIAQGDAPIPATDFEEWLMTQVKR